MATTPDASERAEPAPSFEALLPVRLRKICDLFEELASNTLIGASLARFTEMRILSYLSTRQGVPVLEISRDLSVDKAWISRLLKGLEERRLVQRQRETGDGRVVRIDLTQAGYDTYAVMIADVMRHHDRIMEGLDGGAADTLCDLLEANIRAVLARQHDAECA